MTAPGHVNVAGAWKELAPAGDLGANLLKDPSMDAGTTIIADWTGFKPSAPDPAKFPPPYWARGANQSTIHITHDTAEHHSGSASVKMNYTGTSATSAQFMNLALHAAEGIKPSTTYRVSGWIKIPVGEKATLFAKRESMGSQTEARPHMITGDGQWHRQEYFVTTTPTNPVVALQAWIEAPAAGKNVWVDDVEVFEQSVPAFVNVGGAWKPAAEGWVNVAGAWKKMWPQTPDFNDATGGTVKEYTKPDGTKWRVHTFTANGTLAVTSGSRPFSVLAVGGGGAGGRGHMGGGGGAGGFLELPAQSIPVGNHAVVVGAGGLPQPAGQHGGNGGDSKIGTLLTAVGGGGGGCGKTSRNYSEDPGQRGGNGGSGGGSGGNALYNYPVPGGTGTSGQGSNGGSVRANSGWHGSPGGGAGAPGGDTDVGNGGDGKQSSITGTAVWYAGGGGGSLTWTGGTGTRTGKGGKGGGGNGAGEDNNDSTVIAPTAGTDGLGGGGGAGSGNNNPTAARGGSGVVIVAYQIG